MTMRTSTAPCRPTSSSISTVSGAAIIKGNQAVGLVPNKVLGIFDCGPEQLVFTANSDTPYGPLMLISAPARWWSSCGPVHRSCARWMSINAGWPTWPCAARMAATAESTCYSARITPAPFPTAAGYVHRASSNRQIVGVRSLPVGGDVAGAKERIKTVKVYPLDPAAEWTEPQWLDLTGTAQDTTPLQVETSLEFWRLLQETLDAEPVFESYRTQYGGARCIGHREGRAFRARPAPCRDPGNRSTNRQFANAKCESLCRPPSGPGGVG